MDKSILFLRDISIGLLEISTKKLSRIENVTSEHMIYENIVPPFDWFYHDSILIIPDPVLLPHENCNQKIYLSSQEIQCKGKSVVFFHMEEKESYFIASSLTLPEYNKVKNGLNYL